MCGLHVTGRSRAVNVNMITSYYNNNNNAAAIIACGRGVRSSLIAKAVCLIDRPSAGYPVYPSAVLWISQEQRLPERI